jgi:hypothetical protein
LERSNVSNMSILLFFLGQNVCFFTFGFEHPSIYQQGPEDHQRYRVQHGTFAI